MNTTGILLSMMTMVLIVALFVTINGHNPNEDSRQELRDEIAAINKERDALRLQSSIRQPLATPVINSYQPTPVNPPAPIPTTPAETKPLEDETEKQIRELQRQLAEEQEEKEELVKEKEKAERKQSVAEKEASMAWKERTEDSQKRERERKRVEIALKMGTVVSANTEYAMVIFQPANGQQFQSGQTLGIRRNSGILGQIIVQNEAEGQYIANLKPNAYAGGYPEVQEGDEIIVLPASYRAPGEDELGTGTGTSSPSQAPLQELLPR